MPLRAGRSCKRSDTAETILDEYDYLKPEDIRACLLYASRCLEDVSCLTLATAPA